MLVTGQRGSIDQIAAERSDPAVVMARTSIGCKETDLRCGSQSLLSFELHCGKHSTAGRRGSA